MKKVAGKIDIVRLMREGWRLHTASASDGRQAWLSKEVDGALESVTARSDAVTALWKQGVIEKLPRTERQAYWLTYWRMTPEGGQ